MICSVAFVRLLTLPSECDPVAVRSHKTVVNWTWTFPMDGSTSFVVKSRTTRWISPLVSISGRGEPLAADWMLTTCPPAEYFIFGTKNISNCKNGIDYALGRRRAKEMWVLCVSYIDRCPEAIAAGGDEIVGMLSMRCMLSEAVVDNQVDSRVEFVDGFAQLIHLGARQNIAFERWNVRRHLTFRSMNFVVVAGSGRFHQDYFALVHAGQLFG